MLLGSAGLLALALLPTPNATAAPATCRFDPATHVLSLSVERASESFGEVRIRRMGAEIVILEHKEPPQIQCGETPTVTTVDRIEVVVDGVGDGFVDVAVDLGGGMLAPGFTPESDGSSEIEVFLSGGGALEVQGGRGADHFQYLTVGDATGLNLEAGSADRDVDVGILDNVLSLLPIVAEGGRGPDTLDVLGRLPTGVILEGGVGNDILRAGNASGSFLDGGPGKDRIVGGTRPDTILPGSGADTVDGRGDSDLVVLAPDRKRDTIECGGGLDRVRRPDRFDRLRSCEQVLKGGNRR